VSATAYCAGASVTFALSNTASGRTYRLYKGNTSVDVLNATGGAATFTGAFAGAGAYTAQVDAEGEYCPAAMSGTRAVVEKPMPVLLSSGSVTQTVDQNTPITNIIYTAANAAIALSSGTASLPAGVSGTPNGATFTISGTPTAAGTFNYTVTATHVDGGCTNALSGDIIVLPSTPPHAASTQTWTFGTSTLTWSDRIVVSPSNCTSVTSFSTSDANATQYRIYQGLYFYTWTCVMNNATVFCPAPWRVPTLADVQDLINNTNGATLVNTWGSGGWFSGSSYATNVFPYWSSSPCSNTENVYDIEYTNSTLYTDCNYKSWAFQSVCTK
jgi:hypothetical protein